MARTKITEQNANEIIHHLQRICAEKGIFPSFVAVGNRISVSCERKGKPFTRKEIECLQSLGVKIQPGRFKNPSSVNIFEIDEAKLEKANVKTRDSSRAKYQAQQTKNGMMPYRFANLDGSPNYETVLSEEAIRLCSFLPINCISRKALYRSKDYGSLFIEIDSEDFAHVIALFIRQFPVLSNENVLNDFCAKVICKEYGALRRSNIALNFDGLRFTTLCEIMGGLPAILAQAVCQVPIAAERAREVSDDSSSHGSENNIHNQLVPLFAEMKDQEGDKWHNAPPGYGDENAANAATTDARKIAPKTNKERKHEEICRALHDIFTEKRIYLVPTVGKNDEGILRVYIDVAHGQNFDEEIKKLEGLGIINNIENIRRGVGNEQYLSIDIATDINNNQLALHQHGAGAAREKRGGKGAEIAKLPSRRVFREITDEKLAETTKHLGEIFAFCGIPATLEKKADLRQTELKTCLAIVPQGISCSDIEEKLRENNLDRIINWSIFSHENLIVINGIDFDKLSKHDAFKHLPGYYTTVMEAGSIQAAEERVYQELPGEQTKAPHRSLQTLLQEGEVVLDKTFKPFSSFSDNSLDRFEAEIIGILYSHNFPAKMVQRINDTQSNDSSLFITFKSSDEASCAKSALSSVFKSSCEGKTLVISSICLAELEKKLGKPSALREEHALPAAFPARPQRPAPRAVRTNIPSCVELQDDSGHPMPEAVVIRRLRTEIANRGRRESGCVNERDGQGNTALHKAVFFGMESVVEYLLGSAGAAPEVVDHKGQKPIDIATSTKFSDPEKQARMLRIGKLLTRALDSRLGISGEPQPANRSVAGIVRRFEAQQALGRGGVLAREAQRRSNASEAGRNR